MQDSEQMFSDLPDVLPLLGRLLPETSPMLQPPVGSAKSPVDFSSDAGIILRSPVVACTKVAAIDPLAAIMMRICASDESALSDLHAACSARLRAWALGIAMRPEIADEAVSASFMQVWHRAAEFDASRATVAAWLHAIVRSRMIDLMRRARRHAKGRCDADDHELEALADVSPSPSNRLESAQSSKTLRRAMATLSPMQRQVLSLTFLEGLTQQETADQMGLPLGTVKSHSKRGLDVLRRHGGLRAAAGQPANW